MVEKYDMGGWKMVVWLTGLSGAGKTTIAEAIVRVVKPHLPELVLVDGDVIRELFGAGLGFHEEARQEQIGRIQRLAMFLASQNIVVVVAALYSHPNLLRWNRANLPGYFEVYVDAPLPLVEKRDTKGLYSKARSGEMQNVVGVDIPWHVPEYPDMVVNSGNGETPEAIATKISQTAPCFAAALADKLMS